MTYSKTIWVDNSAPAINAVNLNKMEQGIFDVASQTDINTANIATLSTGEVPQGGFTPTGGAEYPTGVLNYSWYITGVTEGSGYTFTGGTLIGQTAYNLDKLIYTTNGWSLISNDSDYIPNGGFKNYLINGGFGVWQRGETITTTSTGEYVADRWFVNVAGTEVVKGTSSSAIGNYISHKTPLALATHAARVTQVIEKPLRLRGKSVTLTYYTFGVEGVGGGTYAAVWRGVDGSPFTTSVYISPTESVIVGGWKKHTFTFTVPSGLLNTENLTVALRYSHVVGTTSHMYFTTAQLEEGTVATPFEQRPIGLELSLCQRYFYPLLDENNSLGIIGVGQASSATTVVVSVTHPPMRTTPTLMVKFASRLTITGSTGLTQTLSTISYDRSPANGRARLLCVASASIATAGNASLLASSDNDNYLWLDAEL